MQVQVTVRFNRLTIEDSVVKLREAIWIGERDGAWVGVPDVDLEIAPSEEPDVILFDGHRVRMGQQLELMRGDTSVTVRHFEAAACRFSPERMPNLVFPVLLAATVLFSLTLQTASDVLRDNPDVTEGVVRTVEALILPEELHLEHLRAKQRAAAQTSEDRTYEATYQEHSTTP